MDAKYPERGSLAPVAAERVAQALQPQVLSEAVILRLCLDVAGKELTRTVEGDPRASGKGPHYAGPIYNVLTDPTEVREDDVLPFVHAYLAGASQSPERSRGAP